MTWRRRGAGRWWIDICLSDRSDDRQTRRQLLWCYSKGGLWTVFLSLLQSFQVFSWSSQGLLQMFLSNSKNQMMGNIFYNLWVSLYVGQWHVLKENEEKLKKKKTFYNQIVFQAFHFSVFYWICELVYMWINGLSSKKKKKGKKYIIKMTFYYCVWYYIYILTFLVICLMIKKIRTIQEKA